MNINIDSDSTFCTGWKAMIEWQMKYLIQKEGLPDKDGWFPQYDVVETNDGITVRFLDQKSRAWFRKLQRKNK